ncbi:hypothetical protein B5S31_g3856 [[Candida] boidinii]|nr:hypothetical protein B5S31_g3856 [[Candida] boidinii]
MLVPPDNFGLVEDGIYRCSKLDPLNHPFLLTLKLKAILLLDEENPGRLTKQYINEHGLKLYHLKNSSFNHHDDKKKSSSSADGDNTKDGSSGSGISGRDDNNGTRAISNSNRQNSKHSGKDKADKSGVNSNSTSGSSTSDKPSSSSSNEPKIIKMQDWMVLQPHVLIKAIQILLDYKNNHNILLVDRTEVVVGVLRHIQKWSYSSITNEYRLFSGNKSNYFIETFLELVSIELIPHDDDKEIEDVYSDNEETAIINDQYSGSNAFENQGLIESNSAKNLNVNSGGSYSNTSMLMRARRSFNEQNPGDNFTSKAPIPITGSSFSRRYSNTGIVNNGSVDSNNSENSANTLLSSSNHSNFMNSYKRRSSITSSSFNNGGGSGSFNNKLSVSTSPQIPKNLLKLVEMRRQKKKSSIKDKEKQMLQQQQQQHHHHHKHHQRQNNNINEEDEDNAIEDDSSNYTDHTLNAATNNIRRLSILPDFSAANKDNDSSNKNSNTDLNFDDKSHSNLTKEMREHNTDEGFGDITSSESNVEFKNENSTSDITQPASTMNAGSTTNSTAVTGTVHADGGETGVSGISPNTIEMAFKKINFYQPNSNFWFINDQKKRIHSTIRIKIPKNEYLPPWFTRLRDCWEAEFQELNSLM